MFLMTLCIGLLFFSLKTTVKTHLLTKKHFSAFHEELKAYHFLKETLDKILLFTPDNLKIEPDGTLTIKFTHDQSSCLEACDFFIAQFRTDKEVLVASVYKIEGTKKILIKEEKLLEDILGLTFNIEVNSQVLAVDFQRAQNKIEWTFFLNSICLKPPAENVIY